LIGKENLKNKRALQTLMAYHWIDSKKKKKGWNEKNTLNGIVTAFDPVASVVLGSWHRWELAVGWRDVTKFITHVTTVTFHGRIAGRSLIVDDIIWSNKMKMKQEMNRITW
jgi:hypothetical protein